MISAAHSSFPLTRSSQNQATRVGLGTQIPAFRLVVSSKKWDFQDFQGYAKPRRLLPASEVQLSSASSLEQMMNPSSTLSSSESLYRIKLETSPRYGSSLTDLNSGLLVCVTDEKSDSILVRLPACTASNDSMLSEGNVMSEVLHFQRGSVDEYVFRGPTLANIAAIWIGLESGQWRLGNISLLVHQNQTPPEEIYKEQLQGVALQYKFGAEDDLLGEGSDFPMIELRPCSVAEVSVKDFCDSDMLVSESSSLSSSRVYTEDTMKEYADLKFSLLFYDTVLVLAGSLLASYSTGDDSVVAFLTGGAGGFLYLLLLQKSVDTLPLLDLAPNIKEQNTGKFKNSATSLALAFTLAIVAAKYASGDAARMLEPKDVIYGMVGFLMCKISVVLAAFKPLPTWLRQNK